MQEGAFVSIDYIGRIKDTGEIFDLTDEKIAKEQKIFRENVKYAPVRLVVGAGFVIRGLDEALKEMKVGERKTVEIEPSKAFGERNTQLIRLIPISIFKQQNIDPNPGSYVTINGIPGRVTSNDGGRVKVDFNHPLAGKTLQYEIEMREEITKTEEKIITIATFLSGFEDAKFDVDLKTTVAEIKVKSAELNQQTKQKVSDTILKWIPAVKTVKFVDVYTK